MAKLFCAWHKHGKAPCGLVCAVPTQHSALWPSALRAGTPQTGYKLALDGAFRIGPENFYYYVRAGPIFALEGCLSPVGLSCCPNLRFGVDGTLPPTLIAPAICAIQL